MRISIIFPIALLLLALTAASCRGSASKKAATEAVEYLEKKGAGMIERSGARVAEEESDDALRAYRRARQREKINNLLDGGSAEPTPQPQPVTVMCSQCNGGGFVYMLDGYGNVMTDYYGNPLTGPCPGCGGYGQRVVYQ